MQEIDKQIDVNEILQRNAEMYGTTREKALERNSTIPERLARIKTYHDLKAFGMSTRAIGEAMDGRGHRAIIVGLGVSLDNLSMIFEKQRREKRHQPRNQARLLRQQERVIKERQNKRDQVYADITIATVSNSYGLNESQFYQNRKYSNQARETAQYIMRLGTELSFKRIANRVGRKDRSTAERAFISVETAIETDLELKERIKTLINEINLLTERTLKIPQESA